jgi:hypothetical protein
MEPDGIIRPVNTSRRVPWLLLLVAGAFVLRTWGIAWGLPDQYRAWSFHPDESQVLVAALDLDLFAARLDSGFYNYGQGYLLLVGTLAHLLERVGLIGTILADMPPPPGTLLLARLVTAVLGTISCVLIQKTGSRLHSPTAGWVAALIWAVSPLGAQHAHFATVDVPAAAAVCLALYFTSCWQGERKAVWLTAAGMAAGFAGAVKYNAGLVVLSPMLAGILPRPRRLASLIGLCIGTAVGFLLGCPGALVNTKRFREDLLFEATHMGAGSENLFLGTAPGWAHHALVNLPWALGPILAICTPLALAVVVRRRSPADALLAAFAIPYFLLIGSAQVKFARYLLPLLPALCLWIGFWAAEARDLQNQRRGRFIGGTLRAGIAMAFLLSISLVSVFSQTDPRDRAAQFLRSAGTNRVAFARRPWYWSPPLAPGLAHFSPAAGWQAALRWTGTPSLAAPGLEDEWSLDFLDASSADTLVISEFEAEDSLRLQEARVVEYMAGLDSRFARKTIFSSPPAIGPIVFVKTLERSGLPVQVLPHDMTYANPVTVVWQK